jgi:hypothetical protein
MSTYQEPVYPTGPGLIDVFSYLSWYIACFHSGES